MIRRYPLGLVMVAVVAGMVVCGVAQAGTVPLSDLLQPGVTFASGDKIFSDFTYEKTGDNPGPENVLVKDIQDAMGHYGIRIQGGFLDLSGGDASDALITFTVSVPAGSNLVISDAHLSANPAVFDGTGLASVTETFLPDIKDDKLVVYDLGGGDDKLHDSIVFAQTYKTLRVQKDIILYATDVPPGQAGKVTLSFVDQTFSQVPEPSSLALIAVGMLAIGYLRKR